MSKKFDHSDLITVAMAACRLRELVPTLRIETVVVDFDAPNLRFWVEGEDRDRRRHAVTLLRSFYGEDR